MNKTHNYILLSIKNSKKIINLENTQYPIVKQIAEQQGFQIGCQFFTLYWTDCALTIKEIRQSFSGDFFSNEEEQDGKFFKLNAKVFSQSTNYSMQEYDFYPETFILPMDHGLLLKKHNKQKYYIIKPENGCQGKGIYITNNLMKIEKSTPMVVQRYIMNPYLVDNLKFDMRIYVLITCVQPLRIFMFKDGLARFATQSFAPPNQTNVNNLYTHLTNYAINKNHEQFTVNDQDFSTGHKRLLSFLFTPDVLKTLHKNISNIVIKSVIAVLPTLQNALMLSKKESSINSCFQLLGYDIMMTADGKLKLIEINQNPSLMTETAIDLALKKELLSTMFEIIQSTYFMDQDKFQTKQRMKDKKQLQKAGNFVRIYPCNSIKQTQQYDKLIAKSQQIFKQKFGINIKRDYKRQTFQKQVNQYVQWNQSTQFYSREKVSKVYGASKNVRTSQRKRVFLF